MEDQTHGEGEENSALSISYRDKVSLTQTQDQKS